MLDILIAGLAPNPVGYRDGWALQRRIHDEVARGVRGDTLILLEHEPVFTAGTRTEPGDRPRGDVEVIDVDRGGRITWHGPGQLVGYPILRLPEPVDVVAHVRRIERLLIDVFAGVGVASCQVAGRSGVWVRRGDVQDKVAAIGVRVERGVTMHGFAVNCDNTLHGFAQIEPCGISDAGVTTLSTVAGRPVAPSEILPAVVAGFQDASTAVAA